MRTFVGYEKGINLGGWLSQCCHTQEHYARFITEEDFKAFSTWGIDHVRVPVDYDLLETPEGDCIESGEAYIQLAVDWCEKYHLNMILDLHKTAGYSFDDGEEENGFFVQDDLQERFYRLWERLATRFGKYHDRVAFELLNEVTDPSYCEPWNAIAETCIRRIRAIVPEVYILIGGYYHNSISALKDLRLPYDDRIVYNFHCYDPILFTHQGAYWIKGMPADFRMQYPLTADQYRAVQRTLAIGIEDLSVKTSAETMGSEFFDALFADAAVLAEERNVPLYCGEYGVINLADAESTVAWYQAIHAAFEKYGISRAAWSYKEMDFGLADAHLAPVVKQIQACL